MKNQDNFKLNKHMNNVYSFLHDKLNSEILFNKEKNLKKENEKHKEDINSSKCHLIKEKNKGNFRNEEKVDNSTIKRLNTNSLFTDEALANNFTFHLSMHDNPICRNKKEQIIYEKRFNDDDDYINKCNFIDFSFLMDKKKQTNGKKFNFGEDPYSIYKKLINQLDEGFITNETKDEILNFIKNINSFPVFKFKSSTKNIENNELINKDYNDNSQKSESIDSLSKNIFPVRHVYNVPIIIENNQLKENQVNDGDFNKVNSEDSSSDDINLDNYKLIQNNKTFSKDKHKLKANNEKSLIYKRNTKFTICLDEISFDNDNIKNKHYSKKIKRDKGYYIKLNNE
jgi:hypothetical protein